MIKQKNIQIIYINGPTSSGKSTLIRALQNALEKPFLAIGIDSVIAMMPNKYNDWHTSKHTQGFSWQPAYDEHGDIVSYTIETGPFGEKMVQTLKDIVIVLAKLGHYLIIDDVSFGDLQVDKWRQALREFKVLWVGITAPLEILEEREKKRGDRKLLSCRWQADRVHRGVAYDLIFDTHMQTTDEIIEVISCSYNDKT